MTTFRKRWILFLLPFVMVGLMGLTACSSDDDDDPGTGSGNFTPDTSSAPGNSVYLSLDRQDNDTIVLAVKAQDMSNVYGVWFNLDFDGNVFEYVSAEEGTFLRDGADTFFFSTGKSYTVVLGVSRTSDAGGKSGSGTICKLTFRGIGDGLSRFDFSSNHAADPNGNEIGGISWFGGTATVVN